MFMSALMAFNTFLTFSLWTTVEEAFTGISGLAGDVLTFITGNALLATFCIGLPLAGIGISLLMRFIKRSRV